jgi:hypothetical protein
MSEYQLTASEAIVIRTVDQTWIPDDPANHSWVEYQHWLAAGNVPDPYVTPPPAQDANMRLDAGILAAVGTVMTARDAIHAIPSGGALPPRLDALLLQMKVTMDAFVSMLQAQANT